MADDLPIDSDAKDGYDADIAATERCIASMELDSSMAAGHEAEAPPTATDEKCTPMTLKLALILKKRVDRLPVKILPFDGVHIKIGDFVCFEWANGDGTTHFSAHGVLTSPTAIVHLRRGARDRKWALTKTDMPFHRLVELIDSIEAGRE